MGTSLLCPTHGKPRSYSNHSARTLTGRVRWNLQMSVSPRCSFFPCKLSYSPPRNFLTFCLILPSLLSPVKDLLGLDFPKRSWWVHGLPLLFCPCTSLGLTGLLPALPKLCWSMRKAEHMVFALHFWYHKAGPRSLTLNCVPISSIRSSEEQPVLSLQYQPVTLSQDIWWYVQQSLPQAHINVSVFLFCTTQSSPKAQTYT